MPIEDGLVPAIMVLRDSGLLQSRKTLIGQIFGYCLLLMYVKFAGIAGTLLYSSVFFFLQNSAASQKRPNKLSGF